MKQEFETPHQRVFLVRGWGDFGLEVFELAALPFGHVDADVEVFTAGFCFGVVLVERVHFAALDSPCCAATPGSEFLWFDAVGCWVEIGVGYSGLLPGVTDAGVDDFVGVCPVERASPGCGRDSLGEGEFHG